MDLQMEMTSHLEIKTAYHWAAWIAMGAHLVHASEIDLLMANL